MKFFQFHIRWYIGKYDIVICRAQSFISFKEILYQNIWGPYIAIGRPISVYQITIPITQLHTYFCISDKVVVFVILRSNRLSILIKLYTKCRYFLNWMKGFYGGSKIRQANVIKGDVCVDCELPLPSGTKPTYLGTYIIECFLICFQILYLPTSRFWILPKIFFIKLSNEHILPKLGHRVY